MASRCAIYKYSRAFFYVNIIYVPWNINNVQRWRIYTSYRLLRTIFLDASNTVVHSFPSFSIIRHSRVDDCLPSLSPPLLPPSSFFISRSTLSLNFLRESNLSVISLIFAWTVLNSAGPFLFPHSFFELNNLSLALSWPWRERGIGHGRTVRRKWKFRAESLAVHMHAHNTQTHT